MNILLQAYISQLKLEGFALVSDMVYVTQVKLLENVCYIIVLKALNLINFDAVCWTSGSGYF